jgi:O-methyltransferase involved in polyketide biosynthesis
MEKIVFKPCPETLLIPLYGKAMESIKSDPILMDKKAVEIVKPDGLRFSKPPYPRKNQSPDVHPGQADGRFCRNFLAKRPDAVVVHLGCGLDSRYFRIGSPAADWYDVDLKDVIALRRLFYRETGRYHLVASSVTQPEWIEAIAAGEGARLVVAEGLMMYLREAQIKTLISRLAAHLGHFTLIFDAFGEYAAKNAKYHPSLQKSGAKIQWGLDDPKTLCGWRPDIRLVKEIAFTDNEEIQKLDAGTKLLFKTAQSVPVR